MMLGALYALGSTPAQPAVVQAAETSQALPLITPTAGMVVTQSSRVAPGTYRLPVGADAAALRVQGEGITLDLTGVTLEGADAASDPDGFVGTAILIEDAAGVTVRGGRIRGYKTGLLARRTPRLHVTGTDLSHNWKPRLWSGIEKESLVDWMSYHDNEQDQWLRFGAGIYLSECESCEVDHTRVVQGQNGLMATRSSRLKIWNNTYSWNSGVGIGLYRTTDSLIQHNRVDWNVRGYSHGFYFRGQDSTAILLYEQTSRNVIADNSFTHGGDGVFLWAGQSTMDTGQGGANDNLFVRNDVSHAVANGIEATFSRNQFAFNRIEDCWHGVWGGYSYDSAFIGNTFARNTEAIAIEHGQNITIAQNQFTGDATAVRLWANPTQDPNWGYPKSRDTRSRDYRIEGNAFDDHKVAFDVTRTSGVVLNANTFSRVAQTLQAGVDVRALAMDTGGPTPVLEPASPPKLAGGLDAMLPPGARRGRDTIIVDEWGPYDYRSPKLWPAGKPHDRPLTLRVLGPPGGWRLVSVRGGRVSRTVGRVPGEVVLTPAGAGVDVDLRLEYVGGEVTSPRGAVTPPGAPVRFGYRLFEPAGNWSVRAWTFTPDSDPIDAPDAFARVLRAPPAKSERAPRLEYLGSRALMTGLPNDRVAMRAERDVTLPPGSHEMVVISDDGVRVWVDGRLVLDRWDVHGSVVDRVPLTGGRHRIRLDYFEMTGWAELHVRFVPADLISRRAAHPAAGVR